MKHKESSATLVTLANLSEIATAVARGVVGNDVANTLNGTPMSRETLHNLIQARLSAKLATFTRR